LNVPADAVRCAMKKRDACNIGADSEQGFEIPIFETSVWFGF
jgi:hypothetical protein